MCGVAEGEVEDQDASDDLNGAGQPERVREVRRSRFISNARALTSRPSCGPIAIVRRRHAHPPDNFLTCLSASSSAAPDANVMKLSDKTSRSIASFHVLETPREGTETMRCTFIVVSVS